MPAQIRLSIVSDDFGLDRFTNEGIANGFTNGLLTDTNLMPTCPGFDEAVAIHRRIGIPIGLHAVFTCERIIPQRWGPLTGAPSMIQSDGAFPIDPADTWTSAVEEEAVAEARAQYERLRSAGIPITHIRQHRNLDKQGRCIGVLGTLARKTNTPYVQPDPTLPTGTPYRKWDSFFSLSMFGTDFTARKAELKTRLENLGPGHHLWTVHCSSEVPSAASTDAGNPFAIWKTYCYLDQMLVTDEEVRQWLDTLGIEPVPMRHCPVAIAA